MSSLLHYNGQMDVEIHSFKKHYCFTLRSEYGCTLIRGPSGCGKTAIFDAIMWCLHGMPKKFESKVKVDPTWVSVDFGNFKIVRTQVPPSLCLSIQEDLYEDDAAQEIINATFAQPSHFTSLCYAVQDKFNTLLNGRNKDRLALLEYLANLHDPEPKERVLLALSEVTSDVKNIEPSYDKACHVLEGRLTELKFTREDVFSKTLQAEVVQALTLEEKQLSKDIRDGEMAIKANAQLDNSISHAKAEIVNLNKRIKKVPTQNKEELEAQVVQELKNEANIITLTKLNESKKNYQAQLTQSTNLLQGRSKLEVDQAVLSEAKAQADAHSVYQANLVKLNVKDLDAEIKELETILSAQAERKANEDKRREIARLTLSKANLKGEITNLTNTSVLPSLDVNLLSKQEEEAKLALAQANRAKTPLQCPHCSGVVHLVDSKLVVIPTIGRYDELLKRVNEASAAATKAREVHYAKLNASKRLSELTPKLNEVIKTLDEYGEPTEDTAPPLSHSDAMLKQKRLANLWNITIVERPQHDYDYLALCDKVNRLTVNVNSINDEIVKLGIVNPKSKVKEFQALLKEWNEVELSNKLINEQIAQLTQRVNELSKQRKPEPDIVKLKQRHTIVSSNLQAHKLANPLKDELVKLDEIASSLEAKKIRLINLSRLAHELEASSHILLEKIAIELNNTINSILERIFTEPITAHLTLSKRNKSNDKVRYKVDFTLTHKGCEFTPTELSGGEYIRLNIAITLALAAQSPSPLLMLDELVRSLPSDTKQLITPLFSKYLSDKIVLVVEHDLPEADFDNVLNM